MFTIFVSGSIIGSSDSTAGHSSSMGSDRFRATGNCGYRLQILLAQNTKVSHQSPFSWPPAVHVRCFTPLFTHRCGEYLLNVSTHPSYVAHSVSVLRVFFATYLLAGLCTTSLCCRRFGFYIEGRVHGTRYRFLAWPRALSCTTSPIAL